MTARKVRLTTIQVSTATRDRLYRLKFRKTYDEFLSELCDIFERLEGETEQDRASGLDSRSMK